jgi:hypothetical protein
MMIKDKIRSQINDQRSKMHELLLDQKIGFVFLLSGQNYASGLYVTSLYEDK